LSPTSPTPAVEFLLWLLIAASAIAILAHRLRFPYTVALVLGGVVLGLLRIPILSPIQPGQRPDWLTPDVILILFLPALIFEASIRFDCRVLFRSIAPLILLATVGVLAAAAVTGFLVAWTLGLPVLIALLFGAIISATDPISVVAIFKTQNVNQRLSFILEAESLLNDGTAVVLFQVILGAIASSTLGIAKGAGQFVLAVVGGAALGFACGYTGSKVTSRIDDPQIEIMLSAIVAYGSYLLADNFHLSGVIATGSAGLVMGTMGMRGMSTRTRVALESFWDFFAFIINSLVFLLIGLEVHFQTLLHEWRTVSFGILAALAGRVVAVYGFVPISNLISEKIPFRWQHIFVWGGLRGALALALALSLDRSFPYRSDILALTFGVVIFSILVQGLTIKPVLRLLNIERREPVKAAVPNTP
jgi:CPA1 family monovalent cation:H+ antiporter